MKIGMLQLFEAPAGRSVTRLIEEHVETLAAAETYGFDSVWVAEHHFNEYGTCASPALVLADLARRTHRIRLCTGVLVLPLHHPIRVAEEFAFLDVLSKGRIELGVGRGFQPTEFLGYGVDQRSSRARFDEALEVIRRAWTEPSATFMGEHFTVTDARVRPLPLQKPHPPIWMAAVSEESARRAGELGLNLLCSAVYGDSIDALRSLAKLYRSARAQAGHDSTTGRIGLLMLVYAGATRESAEATYRGPALWQFESLFGYRTTVPPQHLHEAYDTYWKFRNANLRADWSELQSRGAITCGEPSYVRDRVCYVAEHIGIDELLCWTRVGGLHGGLVRESMQRFSELVMPILRSVGTEHRHRT